MLESALGLTQSQRASETPASQEEALKRLREVLCERMKQLSAEEVAVLQSQLSTAQAAKATAEESIGKLESEARTPPHAPRLQLIILSL